MLTYTLYRYQTWWAQEIHQETNSKHEKTEAAVGDEAVGLQAPHSRFANISYMHEVRIFNEKYMINACLFWTPWSG